MSLFQRIGDWLFSGVVRPHQREAAQHAREALVTWDRHRSGKEPEDPKNMEEAARCLLDEYERNPVSGLEKAAGIAREVLGL